jgi:uncharacterized repeat protein (TIGR03806 family)
MSNKYIKIFLLVLAVSLICSCSDDKYEEVSDTLPIATDDQKTYELLTIVVIPVTENDTSGDVVLANTISLKNGIDTDSDGTLDKLTVDNEGIWTAASNGTIHFTPNENFLESPSPIKYTIKDAQGNVSNEANITVTAIPSVNINMTDVPYPRLSDYKFFAGTIKNLTPSYNVIPYEPASSLFSDYAHKKRFVWIPAGQKANYVADNKELDFPVGTILIKNFFYNNVQPTNTRLIIETRLLIKKETGWSFADYIWNDEQTEAFYSLAGDYKNITWRDENNITRTVNYRVPNEVQCAVCHKFAGIVEGNNVEYSIPIGVKPQNLNFDYNYGNITRNQLSHWIGKGILNNNFSLPSPANTVINYNDSSQQLETRVRSYLDANCSHCHNEFGHCEYRPMRFAFSKTGETTDGKTNMGVCVNTQDMQDFPPELNKIINPGLPDQSMLFYRINTQDDSFRMPLHGRTLIHEEGVELISRWIRSLTERCP